MGLFDFLTAKKRREKEQADRLAQQAAYVQAAVEGAMRGMNTQNSNESAATSATTNPLNKGVNATGAKPKKKLGRNLLVWGGLSVVSAIFLAQFAKQGGSLNDQEMEARKAEAKEKQKEKAYEKGVEDPAAEAKAAVAKGKMDATKPEPGAPLPQDANAVLGNGQQLVRAYDEIMKRDAKPLQTGRANSSGGASASGSGASGGRNGKSTGTGQDDQASYTGDEQPTSLSSYTFKPEASNSNPSGLLVMSQPKNTEVTGATAKPQVVSEPDRATAARQQAAALADNLKAGATQQAQTGASKLDQNTAWMQQAGNSGYLKTTKSKQIAGKKVIFAGTILKCVLLDAVDTALPGSIRMRVLENVYDSKTASILVVPKGSLILGEYNSRVVDGQERVFAAFNSLVTPAGDNVPLEGLQGSDREGIAGIPGELHTHFWKRMGIAALLAYESALVEKKVGTVGTFIPPAGSTGTTSGAAASTTAATGSAAGQIMLQTANQELQRQYAVAPNMTVKRGDVVILKTANNIAIGE